MSNKSWIMKNRSQMEKPSWDGYDGKPISRATTENALKIADYIPEEYFDVSWDPEGYISFEPLFEYEGDTYLSYANYIIDVYADRIECWKVCGKSTEPEVYKSVNSFIQDVVSRKIRLSKK